MNNPNGNNPDVNEALKAAQVFAADSGKVTLDRAISGWVPIESGNGVVYAHQDDENMEMTVSPNTMSPEAVRRVVGAVNAEAVNSRRNEVGAMTVDCVNYVLGVGALVGDMRNRAVANNKKGDFGLAA